jgi:hypothetical protein
MILMPSNNTGRIVNDLFDRYPGKIARLLNPDRRCASQHVGLYAVDCGAFKRFNESKFFTLLYDCKRNSPPMFVVCPDVVGCHDRTLALWRYYSPRLREYGYPLAFAAQDGCIPSTVPPDSDWIFVGGSNGWKSSMVETFVSIGKPVHVGRVNSIGFVRYCESVGVKSIDGTGWMRARGRQFHDFLNYFNGEVQLGLPTDN